MSRLKFLTTVAIATLIASCVVLWIGANNSASPRPAPRPTTIVRCAEDDPCWDCRTMGNHICGIDQRSIYVRPMGATERR